MSYLSDSDKLYDWFEEGCKKRGECTFKLYNGFLNSFAGRSPVYTTLDKDLNIEDSWDKLSDNITSLSNGDESKFTIYLPRAQDRRNGVDGQLKMFFMNRNRMSSGGVYSEDQLRDKMTIYDLQNRLEALENDNSDSSIGARLTDRLLTEENIGLLIQAGVSLLNNISKKSDGVGHKTEPRTQAYSIEEHIQRIYPHFSSPEEAHNFIVSIIDKFEENPSLFKQLGNE